MKLKFYNKSCLWAAIAISVFSTLSACTKKQTPLPEEGDVINDKFGVPVAYVNNWILENMRETYYWNTSIPKNADLKPKESQPDVFFKSLLYSGDRFSWIEEADNLQNDLSGISTTVGLGLKFIRLNDDALVLAVTYTLKDSPAEKAGLKRGHLITRFNNLLMNLNNYQSVMAPYYDNKPYAIRVATIEGNQIVEKNEVQLTPVENFKESAILLDTILTTNSGKKVGYLFYNRFLNNQVNELIQAFNRFKQAQVEELVLDMRYNGGGGIFVSGVLAGLIYKGFNENDVFVKYKYNSNYRAEDYSYYRVFGGLSSDAAEKENANVLVGLIKTLNLGLTRVFTLATESSASASEIIINNLRPFMSAQNVIHIGNKTVGKNQGSITIVDESKPRKIHWGMQPIVILVANRNGEGDYYNGLEPQFKVQEIDYLPYKPLGDAADPLLSKALSIIDPSMVARYQMQMNAGRKQTEALGVKGVFSFDDPNNKVRNVELGNTLNY